MPSVIAIDQGTTGSKAYRLDTAGRDHLIGGHHTTLDAHNPNLLQLWRIRTHYNFSRLADRRGLVRR